MYATRVVTLFYLTTTPLPDGPGPCPAVRRRRASLARRGRTQSPDGTAAAVECCRHSSGG